MKQDKMLQAGRSMVEMLGVLAIVGVLSIGGIMGYSYAMDKHRANQTIQDINLIRIVLLDQVYKNQALNLNEAEEKTSSGYAFFEPELFDDSIALTVGDVPQKVCEVLVESFFNQTLQIDINQATAENKTDCASGDNEITFYFPINTTGTAERGQNGCSLSTPIYNEETDSCETCPDSAPIYSSEMEKCVSCLNDGDCASGEKCDMNLYQCTTGNCTNNEDCNDTSKYCNLDTQSTSSTTAPQYGTCTAIGSYTTGTGDYSDVVLSSKNMNWFSAQNWCATFNKRVPSFADLGCTKSGCSDWTSLINNIYSGQYVFWWVSDTASDEKAYKLYFKAKAINSYDKKGNYDYGWMDTIRVMCKD